MKRNQSTTIDRHLEGILATVGFLRDWTSTPWHIKKIWIENAIGRLEALKVVANAESILDEIGGKR